MEKTLKELSFECLSNIPKLFDLPDLLYTLKIPSEQMKSISCLPFIEGLTESQVRQKFNRSKIIKTDRFGINFRLYYILFEDARGCSLCLFNDDNECFRALYFNNILLNWYTNNKTNKEYMKKKISIILLLLFSSCSTILEIITGDSPCAYPNCTERATDNSAYCPYHKPYYLK